MDGAYRVCSTSGSRTEWHGAADCLGAHEGENWGQEGEPCFLCLFLGLMMQPVRY